MRRLFFKLLTGFVTSLALGTSGVRGAETTKLVLVGGGHRPAIAMRRFAEWAGGANARVLIIGWSSEVPEEYFTSIAEDLRAQGVRFFTASGYGPRSEIEISPFRRKFLRELGRASAVFFTGGDQSKHMRVINLPGIREALLAKYAAGFPFAGTSAGTAIMSEWMLTGEGARVERGLGLLPKGVLVDQHARRAGRLDRDRVAMRAGRIPRGILIDEDMAIAVEAGSRIAVYGPTYVSFLRLEANGEIEATRRHDGESIDLEDYFVRFRPIIIR